MVQVYFCLDWSSLGGISRHPLLGIGQFRILVSAATLWQKRAGRGWWLPPLPPNSGMILDSGGFSVLKAGANEYPFPVEDYLMVAERYRPTYVAARDFPCEPFIGSMPVEEPARSTRTRRSSRPSCRAGRAPCR